MKLSYGETTEFKVGLVRTGKLWAVALGWRYLMVTW